MKYLKYYLIAVLVIALDQAVKMSVYDNMFLGEEFSVFGDWFKIHYTLNPGMAFGLRFGSEYGKLGLTFFRLIAMGVIIYYLFVFIKRKMHTGFLVSMALILAGAIGNLVDSVFYGVLLDGNTVYMMDKPPFYPWFHGQVIDMFYIDIWSGYLPESIPFVGGTYLSFWPIFNVADSSIFVGVAMILIFQKRFFPKEETAQGRARQEETSAFSTEIKKNNLTATSSQSTT